MGRGSSGQKNNQLNDIQKSVERKFIDSFTSQRYAESGYWRQSLRNEIGRVAFDKGVEITTKQMDNIENNIIRKLPSDEEVKQRYARRRR